MNAITYYSEAIKKVDEGKITIGEYERMINVLRDVEPVVRCRDCKWRDDQKGTTKWMPCRALVTPNDFYCASGERKDGEHDRG